MEITGREIKYPWEAEFIELCEAQMLTKAQASAFYYFLATKLPAPHHQ